MHDVRIFKRRIEMNDGIDYFDKAFLTQIKSPAIAGL